MSKIVKTGNRIFGIDRMTPFRLVFSEANNPRAFPLLNFLDIEEAITSIGTHNFGLLLWTNDKTFVVSESAGSFRADLVNDQLGCNGLLSNVRVKGLQIVTYEDRVFLLTNDLTDPWMLHAQVFDKFRDDYSQLDMERMIVVHDRSRFRVLWFGRTIEDTTNTANRDLVLVWQYGTQGFSQITGEGSGTDPNDLRVGLWYEIDTSSQGTRNTFAGIAETGDVDRPELFLLQQRALNENLYVNKFDSATNNFNNNATGDQVINCVIETAPVQLGGGR